MSESSGKPRAVVDTNLFVSSDNSPLGPPGRMLDAWRVRRFRLLLSGRQLLEVTDVFGRASLARRFRLSRKHLDEMLDELAAAEKPPLHPASPVEVRDPNDEHILAPDLGGAADYLVSGDEDLLSLGRVCKSVSVGAKAR